MTDENFEVQFSDTDDEQTEQPTEIKPTEEIITEYKTRKIVAKPKKRILTAKQLETSRLNLEKARLKRAENKANKLKIEKKGKDEYVIDEDSYTDTDSEEEPQRKPVVQKQQKRTVGKGEKPQKMSKAEERLMIKMDKIEGIIGQLSSAKREGKRSVHKTVIVQPPNQYPQSYGGQRDPSIDHLKRNILLDIF